ncbi:MAG: ligand-binding SRPBCC domain-containing protein [Saprospiraceae bacterium]|jgi:ligand-binding SRPBCC domain-containing protein
MAIFQKLYRIETEQFIPISIDEAWGFFSSSWNLKEITPDHMGFVITSKSNEKMYPGMLITYIVTPLLGIGMRWCTEITHVKDKSYFIDQQRFGPYNMWHHQHHFEEVEGGVMMRDIVNYGIPLGVLGQIANTIMVRSQLKEIFDYRIQAVERLWPVKEGSPEARINFF